MTKKKDRREVVTVYVLSILTILITNLSTNFSPELKLKSVSLGVGTMFGSLLYYFRKEDKRK